MLFLSLPGDKFDKVVIEGDAGTSIKDRRVSVTNEVSRNNLKKTPKLNEQNTNFCPLYVNIRM